MKTYHLNSNIFHHSNVHFPFHLELPQLELPQTFQIGINKNNTQITVYKY